MKISAHAEQRMVERGISRATVNALVVHGYERPCANGCTKYELHGFVVVVDPRHVVVTAYESKPKNSLDRQQAEDLPKKKRTHHYPRRRP